MTKSSSKDPVVNDRFGFVIVLGDKTKTELGIDCTTLRRASNKKVYVECKTCHEIFLREWRFVHQRHACALVRPDDKVKRCCCCNEYLALDAFHLDRPLPDGSLSQFCATCRKRLSNTHGSDLHVPCLADGLYKGLTNVLSDTRVYAEQIGAPFSLTYESLLRLWVLQNGKCFYSKAPLVLMDANDPACIVRRYSSSFSGDNVVWCTSSMRWAKGDTPEHEFIELLALMGSDYKEEPIRIECKLLVDGAKTPTRDRSTDAGYDLYSVDETWLPPNSIVELNTGIAVSVPPGYYYSIDGRSKLWKIGILPFRGIIDATYTGPLVVVLQNNSATPHFVEKGDRIAQLIVNKITHCDISIVNEFSPMYSQRGNAGFGSSGK